MAPVLFFALSVQTFIFRCVCREQAALYFELIEFSILYLIDIRTLQNQSSSYTSSTVYIRKTVSSRFRLVV